MAVVGYFICFIITKPILEILYPQWLDTAMEIVPVTILSTVIASFCSLINPFALKYCSIHWQVIINFISIGSYVVMSLILVKYYGLIGFCWGTVVGYIVKLLITIFIYFTKNKNN